MFDTKKAMGVAMAVAAAGMMSTTTPVFAASSADSVHCYGVNRCKGHSDCKTANNACKGQAACKGQGFVKVSTEACDHLGGTIGD